MQLTSRASQNIHIVYNSNRIDSIKIDLQHTEHIEGYQIVKEIEAYNAKSADRVRKKRTIFEQQKKRLHKHIIEIMEKEDPEFIEPLNIMV